jgi:hypothetical protein
MLVFNVKGMKRLLKVVDSPARLRPYVVFTFTLLGGPVTTLRRFIGYARPFLRKTLGWG